MAFETISPNMGMPIPGVGATEGPVYASDLNSSLLIVDQHDHTTGRGVQITPSGINISADLPFNNNNITSLRSGRLVDQVSSFTLAADVGCVYRIGVDLYYRDGSGNNIRITQSGSVAGSTGTITGLPSGTASAAFSAGTFIFQSATNTSANLDFGSAVLRNNTASSFGLTLSPPTLGANYSIILPTLPASTSAVNITSSGSMSTVTYDGIGQGMTATGSNAIGSSMTSTGANSIASARTRTTGTSVAIGGVAISVGSGFQSTSSATFSDVTNLSVTITTSGRPVRIQLVSDASYVPASVLQAENNGSTATVLARFQFVRGATVIGIHEVSMYDNTTNSKIITEPVSCLSAIDAVAAGTYTYKLQYRAGALSFAEIGGAILVAYEL